MDLIDKYIGMNEVSDNWQMSNKKFSLSYDSKTKKYSLIVQGTGKVMRTFDKKMDKEEIGRKLYGKGYSEF